MTTIEAYPMLSYEALTPPKRRPNSAFWPSILYLILSLMGLLVVGHEPVGLPVTLLTGTACTLMLAYCVCRKYKGRWELNAELVFILGTAIQFFLASLVFRIMMTEQNANYRLMGGTSERLEVKHYWTQGFLITGAFFGAYLATSALIPLPRSRRLLDGRLNLTFTKRSVVIMGFFGIGLWLIRSWLLATGSFYHQYRSSFQEEDWRYSGWTQYDGGVGPVLVAYLWAAAFAGHIGYPAAIGYLLVDTGWNFLSGSRQRTLAGPIAVVLTYIIYRRKFPWKAMLLAAVPVLLAIGFMDQYRQVVHKYAEVDKVNISALVEAVTSASERTEQLGPMETALTAMARLTELDAVARIYQGTPTEHDYLDGETFKMIPLSVIPRQLWPDKPAVNWKINYYFFRHEGGQSPLTVMGEGYMNFGWIGIIISGVIAALMLRCTDWIIRLMLIPVAMLPVYIGFLAVLERMATQNLAMWMGSLPKVIFMGLIVYVFSTRFGAQWDASAEQAPVGAEGGAA